MRPYARPRIYGISASRAAARLAEPGEAMHRPFAVVFVIAAVALGACGGRGPVPVLHEGLHAAAAEITVGDAIAAENGYARGAVEVMVSRAQLRVLISDRALAEADAARYAAAASAIAASAEKTLASDPDFPAIEVISVAIVHPPQLQKGTLLSHTEEVYEFRRGPDARFMRRGE
jgi:hypothetical protein